MMELLVDPGNVLLALFHDPGLETAVSVLRNIELKFAVIAADFFLFSAVTMEGFRSCSILQSFFHTRICFRMILALIN